MKVLLVDDHTLVRNGLAHLVKSCVNEAEVTEAGNADEATQILQDTMHDVALVDITMPSLTGLEVARRVADEFETVRIIILSMHTSEDYIARAIRAGVSGYLLKTADPIELELALRAAMNREMYLSPGVSKQLVEDYLRRLGSDDGLEEQLTARQREILQLIAEGKATKDIAVVLDLSVKTVETHRKDLMERLGIHDVPGLVRYAIRTGIIRAD